MTLAAREKAREITLQITDALGGRGIFGVELFIKAMMLFSARYRPVHTIPVW